MRVKLYLCGGEAHKTNCEVPLGIGYLISNCLHKDWDLQYVQNKNELYDADMIALSSCANGVNEAISILKKATCPVIIGGQISLWKGLEKYNFKHIVKGEGEVSLVSILNGNADHICESPLIDNIDSLVFPCRGNIRADKIMIITSRGCPYNCAFCSSQEYWKKVRYHSAEYFIDEVKHLISKYPHIKKLNIADDLFASHVKRLREIHSLWIKNKLNKRLILPQGFIRSNIFNEEICALMKEMGFRKVRFGGESASNRVLKLLNKQATVEDHVRTIEICRKHRMGVSASFMLDIPGETEEEKQMTIDFIAKHKHILGNGGRYTFRAFPGTKFYNGEDITKVNMRVRP